MRFKTHLVIATFILLAYFGAHFLSRSDSETRIASPSNGSQSASAVHSSAAGGDGFQPCLADQKPWRHRSKSQCHGRDKPSIAALESGGRIRMLRSCAQPAKWSPCLHPDQPQDLTVRVEPTLECVIVYCDDAQTYLTQAVPKPKVLSAEQESSIREYNVVSFLLDSVSVSHFHRTGVFPKTNQVLAKIAADPEFSMFEFCGLGVVGVGSQHNQGAAYRHLIRNQTVFHTFHKRGYVVATAIAASTNNQNQHLNGDVYIGSDHDLLTGLPPTVGWKAVNAPKCFGEKYYDEIALQWMRQMVEAYSTSSSHSLAVFGYGYLPHSPDLSYGYLADPAIAETFQSLYESGFLRKTILLFWSDHGLSYGSHFHTAQGRKEHRNPMLMMVVPNSLLHKYPTLRHYLRTNQRTPITHFDLYATFEHLAQGFHREYPPTATSSAANSEPPEASVPKEVLCLNNQQFADAAKLSLGYSLFGPVPSHRTCAQMGIRCNFCDQVEQTEIHRNDVGITRAVKDWTDSLSANYSRLGVSKFCSPLHFMLMQRIFRMHESYVAIFQTASGSRTDFNADPFPYRLALWELTLEKLPAPKVNSAQTDPPEPEATPQYLVREAKRISTYAIDEAHCPDLDTKRIHHQFCLCTKVPKTLMLRFPTFFEASYRSCQLTTRSKRPQTSYFEALFSHLSQPKSPEASSPPKKNQIFKLLNMGTHQSQIQTTVSTLPFQRPPTPESKPIEQLGSVRSATFPMSFRTQASSSSHAFSGSPAFSSGGGWGGGCDFCSGCGQLSPMLLYFVAPMMLTIAACWILLCADVEAHGRAVSDLATLQSLQALQANSQKNWEIFQETHEANVRMVQNLLSSKDVSVSTVHRLLASIVGSAWRFRPTAMLLNNFQGQSSLAYRLGTNGSDATDVWVGRTLASQPFSGNFTMRKVDENGLVIANEDARSLNVSPTELSSGCFLESTLNATGICKTFTKDSIGRFVVGSFFYSNEQVADVVRNSPETIGILVNSKNAKVMHAWGDIALSDAQAIMARPSESATVGATFKLESGVDCYVVRVGSPSNRVAGLSTGFNYEIILLVPQDPHFIQPYENHRLHAAGLGIGCLAIASLVMLLSLRMFVLAPVRRLEDQLRALRNVVLMQQPCDWAIDWAALPMPRSFFSLGAVWEAAVGVAKAACDVSGSSPRNSRGGFSSLSDDDNQTRQMMRAKDMGREMRSIAVPCTFFATMSHEMRTPLNACIGMAEVMLGTPLSERQKECVDAILVGGYSMQQLVNDILDFSKLQADKLVLENIPFNVRECVEHSAQVVQLKADEKALELIVLVKSDVPQLAMGDPSRLRQVLFNLLSNAVKFTSKGFIAIRCKIDHGMLVFEVQDSGLGLSTTTIAKLFQPFVQADSSTSRKYGGSGLGLVIAKQIVQMMGGQLQVESEGVGCGSLFHFAIPFRLPEPSSHRPSSSMSRSVSISCSPRASVPAVPQHLVFRVLDKNEMRVEATTELLCSMGTRYSFHSEMSDLASISTESGDVQVVVVHLTDVPAPVQEGLRRLRESVVNGRVLLITSIKNTLPDGFVDGVVCISKPISMTKVHHVSMKLVQLNTGVGYSLGRRLSLGSRTISATISNVSGPAFGSRKNSGAVGFAVTSDLPPYASSKFNSMKVLVVDDVILNQRVITLKLQQAGFIHIDAVSSGKEALTRIRSETSIYDVILMDISMPELDGYETTRAIKLDPRYECVPVIGVTGNCMAEDIEEGLNAGMLAVLSKPINTEDLLGLLDDLASSPEQFSPKGGSPAAGFQRPLLEALASTAHLMDGIVLPRSDSASNNNRRRSARSGSMGGFGGGGSSSSASGTTLGCNPESTAAYHPCAIQSPLTTTTNQTEPSYPVSPLSTAQPVEP